MHAPSSSFLPTLNIGILAHVDAGKTSLTERLLFDFGATAQLGSVDAGNTRTDSGSIERRRGITVRTAVTPFTAHGVQINLLEIAEVEVYEPYHFFETEVPPTALAAVSARLAAFGAIIRKTVADQEIGLLAGEIPARNAHHAQQALPNLSRGEGTWWSSPAGYRPT